MRLGPIWINSMGDMAHSYFSSTCSPPGLWCKCVLSLGGDCIPYVCSSENLNYERLLYTLISMTGSGHVKYQENPLAYKLRAISAWKIISFYLLYSQLHILMPSGNVLIMCMLSCINNEHIFLSFGKDLHGQSSCHLYMAFELLQNMTSGHVKVKKGLATYFTWPLTVSLLRVYEHHHLKF